MFQDSDVAERSPLETVIDCDEFLWTRNHTDLPQGRMVFVHLTVKRWSKDLLTRLQNIWNARRSEFPNIVFAQPNVDSHLFERFAAHFGFRPITDCICTDGQNRRIFVNFKYT